MPSSSVRPRPLWVLVVLAVLMSVAVGPSAWADDPPVAGTGFGISPVDGQDTTGDRSLFAYGLPPEGVVPDRVAVLNYSPRELVFDLYPVDAVGGADGSVALSDGKQKSAMGLADWITLDTPSRQVTVPGRDAGGKPGKVIVPVTITVPANAEPGDHAGGIVASLGVLGQNPQSQNVRLEQRVGARVYVRVAGAAKPSLAISRLTAAYVAPVLPWQKGRLKVDYTIVNTGNVRMGVQPTLDVRGPFGLGAKRIDAPKVAELLPHEEVNATQVIEGVWPTGPNTLRLTASATATLMTEAPQVGPVTKETVVWALAWWELGLLLLLVLLVAAVAYRRRHRRNGRRRRGRHGHGPAGPPSTVPPLTRREARAGAR